VVCFLHKNYENAFVKLRPTVGLRFRFNVAYSNINLYNIHYLVPTKMDAEVTNGIQVIDTSDVV